MRDTLRIPELKSLSFDKIERLQNARFRAVAQNFLPQTKFYANLFKEYNVDPKNLKTVEDWQTQGLPLVKKFYYMKNVKDFIVTPENPFTTYTNYLASLSTGEAIEFYLNLLHKETLKAKLHYYFNPKMPVFSGGTQSGKPTPTFATHAQLLNLQNIMAIAAEMIQSDLKDMHTVGMNLFPYGPHLAWHAVNTAFNIGVNMNLATAAGGAMRTKDLVIMADKFKANVFAGMAEYIAKKFLPMAVKKKIKLGPKAMFINGSEKMNYKDKTKIISLAKK
jgi:phenylacetate-coenzyme A ligase PaaK-like adenylate-forming protein